ELRRCLTQLGLALSRAGAPARVPAARVSRIAAAPARGADTGRRGAGRGSIDSGHRTGPPAERRACAGPRPLDVGNSDGGGIHGDRGLGSGLRKRPVHASNRKSYTPPYLFGYST